MTLERVHYHKNLSPAPGVTTHFNTCAGPSALFNTYVYCRVCFYCTDESTGLALSRVHNSTLTTLMNAWLKRELPCLVIRLPPRDIVPTPHSAFCPTTLLTRTSSANHLQMGPLITCRSAADWSHTCRSSCDKILRYKCSLSASKFARCLRYSL